MTNNRRKALEYLQSLIRKWGGTLEVFSEKKYNLVAEIENHTLDSQWSTSSEPGYALHWKSKRIVTLDGCNNPGTIIHEMGHVFLDEKGPKSSDEFSWLGWEICLARKAGCYRTWSMQNSDYRLGSQYSTDWGRLTKCERNSLIGDRIEHGKRICIIDNANNPLPRR